MAKLSENNVGKVVEWDGNTWGVVILEDTKKLLVQKAMYVADDNLYLENEAVWMNKNALSEAHWIKLRDTSLKVAALSAATPSDIKRLASPNLGGVNLNH